MAETPSLSMTSTLPQTNPTTSEPTMPSGASSSNASTAPQVTPAATTISTPTMSGPSNGFQIPQISAATEAMIRRIRGSGVGAGTLTGGIDTSAAGLEAARRSILQGMKTTLSMEINTPPPKTQKRPVKTPVQRTPSTSSARKKSTKGKKAGSKRKRVKDESDSAEDDDEMSGVGDDSEDDEVITNSARQTKSGRKVSKPSHFVPADGSKRRISRRSLEQTLCKRCGRGHSPASNMIVFCDRCNLGWHQMCHDPPISEEMVKDENLEWFCGDCLIKSYGFDPNLYVSGRDKTMVEKREHFSSLGHEHLVSLLIHATTISPDLPVFPPSLSCSLQKGRQSSHSRSQQQSDRKITVHPQPPFPPSATRGLFTRAEANPNAKINFIRKIPASGPGKGNTMVQDASRPDLKHSSSAPPTLPQQTENGEDDESRESTPASPPYPRPGNGLMSKLPPDDQDDEWLVDDEDYVAFSHIVYDANGNGEKIEENGVRVDNGVNGNVSA